jgi:hypothetical protein
MVPRLACVLALILAATPAVADEAPVSDLDDKSMTAEIWTAVGSGDIVAESGFRNAEFMFMTGVLGVFRSAPFVAGLSLDFGNQEDDFHVLFGPVAGLGLDLVPGLRVEALLEIGAHLVDGIGYSFSFEEDGATGSESAWLLQGGLRLGLSGRIGRESPRIVVGGWVAVFRDLTTTTETITYPEGGGTETWDVGGSMGLLAVRLGFEW